MSQQLTYLTEEGLKKLKAEIRHLESVERPRISNQIAEARDKGDLSENAEYDAAKDAQGLLELRIGSLKQVLSNARLLDDSQIDTTKVFIHSKVKLLNVKMKREFDYMLVAENEADLKTGRISIESPIGRGLLGLSVGDIADIKVPNGTMQFKVLEINR